MTHGVGRVRAACVIAGLIVTICSGETRASGLYVTERGVRPLGRGGAFVAGADDAGAIAYNPAGIFDAGDSLLIDASLPIFGSQYTRQALLRQVDPNTGETVATYEQTFPTVEGSATPIPVPTIAGTFGVHPDWRLALGVHAPNAIIPQYPEEVDGQPAGSRYQLVSLEGSVLATVGAYVAWRPIEQLRLGLGFEVLLGSFKSKQYLSGCLPERFFCSPEDPEWDLVSEQNAAPLASPSGNLGLIWEFYEGWRVGASFHLPHYISAPSTLRTRLPAAAPFRNAEQTGESATVQFKLPWELRLGVEMRDVVKGLRIEVAGHYEHWAMHDKIVVEPNDVAITNLPGFPKEYFLSEITIPRNFQGSISVMAGAEYEIKASASVRVTPRLGLGYATSAVPSNYISALTLDSGKTTPSVGLGVTIDRTRIDFVYAHQFVQQVVNPAESARLTQVVPIAANEPENPDYINGGIFDWHLDVVGLGFAYTFDHPAPYRSASDVDAPLPEPKKPAPAPTSVPKKGPAPEDADEEPAPEGGDTDDSPSFGGR